MHTLRFIYVYALLGAHSDNYKQQQQRTQQRLANADSKKKRAYGLLPARRAINEEIKQKHLQGACRAGAKLKENDEKPESDTDEEESDTEEEESDKTKKKSVNKDKVEKNKKKSVKKDKGDKKKKKSDTDKGGVKKEKSEDEWIPGLQNRGSALRVSALLLIPLVGSVWWLM